MGLDAQSRNHVMKSYFRVFCRVGGGQGSEEREGVRTGMGWRGGRWLLRTGIPHPLPVQLSHAEGIFQNPDSILNASVHRAS